MKHMDAKDEKNLKKNMASPQIMFFLQRNSHLIINFPSQIRGIKCLKFEG
jgi:hypothetical protein